MLNFSHWQASANEHRIAWIVACCSIATIFLASVWPELFSLKPTSLAPEIVQVETPPAQQETRFTPPKKEALQTTIEPPQRISNTKRESAAVISKIKPVINKKPQQQAPEIKPKKVTATSGNYYVQAGAFKEKSLARKLASRMKKHGWNAIIVPKSGFHAVWVGPKNSRSGIENLQKSIDRTLNIKGFIVQKRSS
jgi:cell division septation protein DedD